jgi:alkanesulfonate monooxygenase SsuD/methylene tetrahydromethanopterin reductase-like flavin-dependent oxidoreductase (luciferase family)
VEQAAALGARLMIFSQQTWESFATGPLEQYRKSYREHCGAQPPPPLTGDLMFCDEDPQRAEALAMQYMPNYFLTIIRHYEIMGEHFKQVKGYDHYATAGELFEQVGLETAARVYCGVQTWGTPDAILEKLRARRELLGEFELDLISCYGGMPVEVAERSLRLFAEKVLPELQRW